MCVLWGKEREGVFGRGSGRVAEELCVDLDTPPLSLSSGGGAWQQLVVDVLRYCIIELYRKRGEREREFDKIGGLCVRKREPSARKEREGLYSRPRAVLLQARSHFLSPSGRERAPGARV